MCVLHVSSNRDSFAKFLAATRLAVYHSHDKGDVKHARKSTIHDDYGFSCDVSKRAWIDASGQIEDAVRFLEVHSAELRSLTSQHQIDDIRLDFPFESRLSEQVVAQYDYLPSCLVRSCAEYGIGIEISHYAPGQSENCEPDAAPNDGPATPNTNSGSPEGPPSVS
jgi:hypothetical protein